MAVKAVKNTAGPNSLVPTLLVFWAYLHMHSINLLALTIIQRANTIKKATEQNRKIRAKNQMINALNTKNELFIDLIHDLLLNSDRLV